uniref:Thioredoxin domain-containing protein n=1 Tax=Triticum urartu TaxID=4572 RepID=A0A8R7Q6C0_TRIUA
MDPALRRRSRLPIHLLLVAVTLLAALAARSGAEVITLTEETFSDKIKEKDTVWFVQFCVPWCKHCKSLGTLWEDLGKVIEGTDEIEIGKVDCGASKPVCSKVDIHSYPTFKVFYDGEEVAKYKGPRDVESLKTFVLNEAEKAGENHFFTSQASQNFGTKVRMYRRLAGSGLVLRYSAPYFLLSN